MTLDQVQEALKDRRIKMVSEATGLHPNTLAKLRDGRNTNPTYEVMVKLSEYLGGKSDVEK